MSSRWFTLRHALLLFALAAPTTALATSTSDRAPSADTVPARVQLADRGEGPRGGGRLSPEERAAKRKEVGEKMDTLLVVELSSRLSLSQEKALKLGEVLKKHRLAREARGDGLRAEAEKLRGLVDKGASDAELKAQTQKLVTLARERDDDALLLDETAKFLTPLEQAKLVLELPELRKDVRGMVREARRRRGDGELRQMDREERFERSQRRDDGARGVRR